MKQIVEDLKMEIQWEVSPEHTSTDGDDVNVCASGVPVVLVSIPLRYMHSSVEIGNWNDIQNCIDLIAEFLMRIDEKFDYCPLS